MASEPTPDVLAALRAAASATNVPLSLLWGVAFAESGFDPSKVGPATATGEHAQGLMQLMPKTAAAYGVTDPFDPHQSAMGGAKMLAKLGKALKWDWRAMLSAYVWGPTAYARAQAQGGQVPADVETYVRRALAARDVYRLKASRPAGTLMTALNAAIEHLALLNPAWAPATIARDKWRPFFDQRRADTDAQALINPTLKTLWRLYQLAYERAPITDETTPLPAQVEPDFWQHAAVAVDRIKTRATETAFEAALGIGGALFVLALFVAVSGRRR